MDKVSADSVSGAITAPSHPEEAFLGADDAVAERLRAVGEVKCIMASSDGRLLGVSTEAGSLAILEVPSMRTRAEIKCASMTYRLVD